MIKKVLYKLLIIIMRKKGYSKYFSGKVVKETFTDFKDSKNVNLTQKIRIYKKGFLVSNFTRYGLTENNYMDYLPDFDYYNLHPINGIFSKWIDDKMTMKYILHPYNSFLPMYYFELYRGKTIKLMDCPHNYNADIESVIKLLKSQKALALKLISGSKGIGFYKISFLNNEFYINDKEVSLETFINFLEKLDGYIVTEYIVAHKNLREVYSSTPNAVRIGVLNTNGVTRIFGAFIRYGTKRTGMVDHAIAGGVFCGVNVDNGIIFDPKIYKGEEVIECPYHPDTGVPIQGEVPHWDLIKNKISEIGTYIPQIKYMGYDIVVTDNGFKILEINSHQSLVNMQSFYPLKKDKELVDFFKGISKRIY